MHAELYHNTLQGGRKSNQDRLAIVHSKHAVLLVVADGMGGHLRGEVAAEIAAGVLTAQFKQAGPQPIGQPKEFLKEGFYAAHGAIGEYARRNRLSEYPRTTCVACLVQDGMAYWAHAGDSRLYLLRDGHLVKRTRDHSRVQRLIDAGLLREDQAMTHPDRNRIYSCLGGDQDPVISLSEGTRLQPGDVLLLASDGFWGTLSIVEIEAALGDAPMLKALPTLVSRAALNGGDSGDNLTVVGMAWETNAKADLSYVDSAVTMPMSLAERTQQMGTGGNDLTDEEIEQTIAEIQAAIQKFSR